MTLVLFLTSYTFSLSRSKRRKHPFVDSLAILLLFNLVFGMHMMKISVPFLLQSVHFTA